MAMRSRIVLGIAAATLLAGCTTEVDRQAAPLPSSAAPSATGTAAPQAPATTAAPSPTATSVPGTEMTPPVDRNVCGRVRTATTEYAASYRDAPAAERQTVARKWSGFIRDRAGEATDPKLRADLSALAAEVDSWDGREQDTTAYTRLLDAACTRYAA